MTDEPATRGARVRWWSAAVSVAWFAATLWFTHAVALVGEREPVQLGLVTRRWRCRC